MRGLLLLVAAVVMAPPAAAHLGVFPSDVCRDDGAVHVHMNVFSECASAPSLCAAAACTPWVCLQLDDTLRLWSWECDRFLPPLPLYGVVPGPYPTPALPDVAVGAGVVLGGGGFCAHTPGPGPMEVVFARVGDGSAWRVVITGPHDPVCGGLVADTCEGTGSLGAGIAVADCGLFHRQGTFGPFHDTLALACAGPCPRVMEGPVEYYGLGGWTGSLTVVAERGVALP